ncbi:MAG: hypothetical protein NW200_14880, partial [Hyphomonadaceae bacterium]|nr:hypothetical protein [Hyphomonadaceae bacterium]
MTPLLADLFFRGIAIGSLAAMGTALARGPSSAAARVAGALFAASAIAYALNSSDVLRTAAAVLYGPIWLLSVAGVGYAWLFLSVLFEDRRLTPGAFTPVAVLTMMGVAGWLFPPGPGARGMWIAHNLIEAAIALHALRFIA